MQVSSMPLLICALNARIWINCCQKSNSGIWTLFGNSTTFVGKTKLANTFLSPKTTTNDFNTFFVRNDGEMTLSEQYIFSSKQQQFEYKSCYFLDKNFQKWNCFVRLRLLIFRSKYVSTPLELLFENVLSGFETSCLLSRLHSTHRVVKMLFRT